MQLRTRFTGDLLVTLNPKVGDFTTRLILGQQTRQEYSRSMYDYAGALVVPSASSTAAVTPVDINIASPNPPTQDIPVTVAIDQAALTAYNKTYARRIQSCQRIATVNINFVGNQIPAKGGPYTLPISITTGPGNVVISANYHTQILVISRIQ